MSLDPLNVVSTLCAIAAAWYARRTYLASESLRKEQGDRDREDSEWSERFERIARQLCRISPGFMIQGPSGSPSFQALYPWVFDDPKLRTAIESYIVEVSRNQFFARSPRPDELRRPVIRETIEAAEERIEDFGRKHPEVDLKAYFG